MMLRSNLAFVTLAAQQFLYSSYAQQWQQRAVYKRDAM
jgi:hypothetical protein